MSTAIYIKIASRAIRTSSTIDCHQEPFSFPSGYSESPTPASVEGASLSNGGVSEVHSDHLSVDIFLLLLEVIKILDFKYIKVGPAF